MGVLALLLVLGTLAALMMGPFPGRRKLPVVAVGLITDYTRSDQELGRPLADMLATDLARTPDLQVISTARMYDLLGKVGPTRDSAGAVFRAAQEAGATELLDGTLFDMGGGRMRLDLRRTDIESGNLRQAYSVEGKDLFALVESGTRELVANLGGMSPGSSLAEATTSSLTAYRLYERGLRALFSSKPGASELFESALQEDSSTPQITSDCSSRAAGPMQPMIHPASPSLKP
jgi:TolB-like protein